MGTETMFELPGFSPPDSYERFRAKARQFLKSHEDHLTIHKLRTNEPLTSTALSELERMLAEGGIGTPDDVEKAKAESEGLGLFVRSLVGLDQQAAKNALGSFLAGGTLHANQSEFLDEIVNHQTEHGCMDIARLYESPYTDFNPMGVDGVFTLKQVDELVSILEEVLQRAIAWQKPLKRGYETSQSSQPQRAPLQSSNERFSSFFMVSVTRPRRAGITAMSASDGATRPPAKVPEGVPRAGMGGHPDE